MSELITFLKNCQKTHIEWAEYFEANPEEEKVKTATGEWDGSKTHRELFQKYEQVIDLIQGLEKSIIDLFKEFGNKASYHFADDSTGEWGLAQAAKDQALKLFDDNPGLQSKMREIAKDFLWSLKRDRPARDTRG